MFKFHKTKFWVTSHLKLIIRHRYRFSLKIQIVHFSDIYFPALRWNRIQNPSKYVQNLFFGSYMTTPPSPRFTNQFCIALPPSIVCIFCAFPFSPNSHNMSPPSPPNQSCTAEIFCSLVQNAKLSEKCKF